MAGWYEGNLNGSRLSKLGVEPWSGATQSNPEMFGEAAV